MVEKVKHIGPAATCRKNGWVVGDVLEGTEHYSAGKSSTCRIQITAIGEVDILAKCVWSNHGRHYSGEGMWTLDRRDWAKLAVDV